MSGWCEFGNVDSDREIVIHVGKVLEVVDHPQDITFLWLSQRLNMPLDDIWAALVLTKNGHFVSALYTAQATEWGYEIVDPRAEVGSPFVNGDDPPPMIAMPRTPASPLEALSWLDYGRVHSGWYDWRLPAEELWLPKHIATMTYLPAIDEAQGARSRKCISVGVGEPHVDTHALGTAAQKLRKAIDAREEKTQQSLARIVLIQKMLALIELQIRDWKHPWTRISDEEKAGRVDRMAKLRDLEAALHDLLEHVVGKPESFPEENAAADDLLTLLGPSGAVGSQLDTFFRELEARPTVVSASNLQGVVTSLVEVFGLLARSSRAEVFLRDHLLEILERTCEHPPPEFHTVVSRLDGSLVHELTEGWRTFLVETRRAVGPGQPSTMARIGTLSKIYRALTGIAGAALHDVMVARVMTALARTSTLDLPSLSRSMAGFILRYLSTHGWTHRGTDGVLTFGRDVDYEAVLKRIGKIGASDRAVDWVQEGKDLNAELGVKNGLLRSYGGVSIGALLSLATFAYAVGNDGKDDYARALDMAAGLAGTSQALAKAAELVAIRRLDDAAAKALNKRAGRLGACAALFGLAASIFALKQDYDRGNSYGMWTNGLGATASALSIGAWALSLEVVEGLLSAETIAMSSFACTGIGLALTAIVLALVLLEDELRDGPSYLVDQYWKQVTHPRSPARRFPIQLERVEMALAKAQSLGAFDDFHMRVGSPGRDLTPDDPPTFHAAHALGFEQREIATLFDVRPAVVRTQANIPDVDYGGLVR